MNAQLTAAAVEIVGRYESDFINQRSAAAALEIVGLHEKTLAESQEETCRYKEKCDGLQKLLDCCIQPEIKIHRIGK